MDAVKDYLAPKTFGILAYVCSIAQFICGVIFTWNTDDLRKEEAEKFTCYVPPESTLVYKTQVDKACFSEYQQHYNAPLRFSIFVLLSTWFPIIIALVYSLWVHRRVKQVKNRNETQADSDAANQVSGQNKKFYVFRLYFIHLAIRVLCGVLFTILQRAVLFPRGFDSKFSCNLSPEDLIPAKIPSNTSQLNSTSVRCENGIAGAKHTWWLIIIIFNPFFSFMMLLEIFRHGKRFPIHKYITGKKCDAQFIKTYLLCDDPRVKTERSNLQELSVNSNLQAESAPSKSSNLQECVDYYKKQVLCLPRSIGGSNLSIKSKEDFDKLYIKLAIYAEYARHKFSNNMKRHEINDVYMEVPKGSVCLEEIKDLFHPIQDKEEKGPSRILVIGRPGIGKTVLTEKIMHDWASIDDEFSRDKIAFYLKFRWFNTNSMKDMTLKTFLRKATRLSEDKFEIIYEEIANHPEKVILIFDGLDEFNTDFNCLSDHLPPPDDHDFPMSATLLFGKLISRQLLPEATILITSRSNANEYYSQFEFDRIVEIIGFTKKRIEQFVNNYCHNNDRDYLKPKIWNHIKSSPDLLNSCYIPVNCWIVSTNLFESLTCSKSEDNALPTTLTELYQLAVNNPDKKYSRKLEGQSTEKAAKKLQSLAYKAIEPMQLIFLNESFDEQMKQSGLLNTLSDPHFPAQTQTTQFCFIHLTIQEFLAAKHVIQKFKPKKIKEFIFSHTKSVKWHLVLQFIAGLLGREIRNFQKDRYKDCVLAFAQCFELTSADGVFDVTMDYTSLHIMKCLREVENEKIVKEACETTAINDIVGLRQGIHGLKYEVTLSDWSAVFFVCKHIKHLKKLDFYYADLSQESYLEALGLLEQRCVEELSLRGPRSGTTGNIFKALMESKCSLNHDKCSKLIKLKISEQDVTNEILLTMQEFFRNGHAIYLEYLGLVDCGLSTTSKLCAVLDNKLCPELACLDLGRNNITGAGITKLCDTLIKQKLSKLNKLDLWFCSLTNDDVRALCKVLRNECCNLDDLSLGDNLGLDAESLRIFCEDALTKEHCKLSRLVLSSCSLTNRYLSKLCETAR